MDDPKCYYFSFEARQSRYGNLLVLQETGDVEVGAERCTNISSIIRRSVYIATPTLLKHKVCNEV